MSAFLKQVTSARMADRLNELRAARPDIDTIFHMLGQDKFLEWAHSIGVTSDERLRALVPPLPPFPLRSVAGGWSETRFLWTGLVEAERLYGLFTKHKGDGSQRIRALDFGVGSGRIARFMSALPNVELSGAEANEQLAAWCSVSLPMVTTKHNKMWPPLDFDSASFDFIYAKSVFSHLTHEGTAKWVAEMARLLGPGGVAVVTVNGYPMLDAIIAFEDHQKNWLIDAKEAQEMHASLASKRFIHIPAHERMRNAIKLDGPYGHTFLHEEFVRTEWPAAGLNVLEYIVSPRGQQDYVVLARI